MRGAQQLRSPERLVEGELWREGPVRLSPRNLSSGVAWRHAVLSRRRSLNSAQRAVSLLVLAFIFTWGWVCPLVVGSRRTWDYIAGCAVVVLAALLASVMFDDAGRAEADDDGSRSRPIEPG